MWLTIGAHMVQQLDLNDELALPMHACRLLTDNEMKAMHLVDQKNAVVPCMHRERW
jgi:hypothetical protein